MSEIWGKMWGIVVWKPECAGAAGRLASSRDVWIQPHVSHQSAIRCDQSKYKKTQLQKDQERLQKEKKKKEECDAGRLASSRAVWMEPPVHMCPTSS